MENSKLQWIRLGNALSQCDNASGNKEERPDIHSAENRRDQPRQWEYQNHLNICLSDAGLSGVLTFRGVKASRPDRGASKSKDRGVTEQVPPEYFCTTHMFEPQKDVIEWHTGEEEWGGLFNIEAERRKDSDQYPMWTNVIVERAAFEAWLPVWLEKWLAEAVRHGWRTPEEAAALMQAAGMAVTPARSATGAPGRPSSMYLIIAEFERRHASGLTEKSLASEAHELKAWLTKTHPNEPQATERTIKNKLRVPYRKSTIL